MAGVAIQLIRPTTRCKSLIVSALSCYHINILIKYAMIRTWSPSKLDILKPTRSFSFPSHFTTLLGSKTHLGDTR